MSQNQKCENNCKHCWHAFRGPIWIVLQDGEVVQSCCHCHDRRVIHIDHVGER